MAEKMPIESYENSPAYWMKFCVRDIDRHIAENTWVRAHNAAKGANAAKAHIAHRHHWTGREEGTDFIANAVAELLEEEHDPNFNPKDDQLEAGPTPESQPETEDITPPSQELALLENAVAKLELKGPMLEAAQKRIAFLKAKINQDPQLEFDFTKK